MLLPSAPSNPASMMGQALTMYKSLLSNSPSGSSGDHQETSTRDLLVEERGDSTPVESGIEAEKTPRVTNSGRPNEPVFSLQSSKKGGDSS